ncbi:MAG: RHS repeat-associated core domain-containing protein [Candidatus Acidiferrum sp.]
MRPLRNEISLRFFRSLLMSNRAGNITQAVYPTGRFVNYAFDAADRPITAAAGSNGNTLNEYIFFGGKRIAMLPAGGNPIYYVEDMLGTSRLITTNSGAVCYDADFDPYGGEHPYTKTCSQNYKFEGKERDTETGNDDFGARYYTDRFGRWLSADWSNVPVAVPYANLTNPQTLNLYAMVSDDPESFADLDGHETFLPGASCSGVGTATSCAANGDPPPNAAAATTLNQQQAKANQPQAQNTANDNTKEGNTTVGALEKTMTNEVGSLSTPKKGDPDVLVDAKDALANTLINNANLDNPAKVAPATGTASTQDAQIMRDAATNRANGGADPVEGRTQFGTTHNSHIQSRSAGNHLKGAAGRETVYEKFGPFRDSVSRRPTWIVIYNNPGQ